MYSTNTFHSPDPLGSFGIVDELTPVKEEEVILTKGNMVLDILSLLLRVRIEPSCILELRLCNLISSSL